MQGNKDDFWNQALDKLKEKLAPTVFETIIQRATPGNINNGKLTIQLPFAYMIRRISLSEKSIIESVLCDVLDTPVSIDFVVSKEKEYLKSTKLAIKAQKTIAKRLALLKKQQASKGDGKSDKHDSPRYEVDSVQLKSNYSFANFVVGDSNLMAHAAAVAVSQRPGEIYNPLFLYSASGLGKTHLLHAIGHQIRIEHPEHLIRVCSSETYTNELIDSIGDKEYIKQFRDRYRHCDALLIDDIHFLIDKEATQEAFFHTFNVLYEMEKQIVITSDRHPRELRTLKERLINRFLLGLIIDIQKPSYETRVAILRRKADSMGIVVDSVILEVFAEKVEGSIRLLEGCLKSTKNRINTIGKNISIEDAEKIAASYSDDSNKSRPITMKIIIDLICHHYRISFEELVSASKESHIVHPRHVGMYLTRKHTSHTFKEIARAFRRKDHATVSHGVKKITNTIDMDAVLAREISYIEDLLLGKSTLH